MEALPELRMALWEKEMLKKEHCSVWTGPTLEWEGRKVQRSMILMYEGGFKEVFRARVKGESKKIVWTETDLLEGDFLRVSHVIKGCKLLESLDHPNIGKMKFWGKRDVWGPSYVTLQEDYGVAFGELKLSSWPSVRFVFQGLAQGLAYLAKERIVHRDLGLFNVVAGRDGVKLIDFDTACRLPDDSDLLLWNRKPSGKFRYQSPERLKREPYGVIADVWSVGIIMYEAMIRTWKARDPSFRRKQWIDGLFDERSSPTIDTDFTPLLDSIDREIAFPKKDLEGMKEIILGCLQEQPEQRLTAAELVQRLGPGDSPKGPRE